MATRTITPDPQGETTMREELGGAVEITDEAIACRAYDIYLSGQGGSDLDHWLRAEEEIRRPV